MSISLNKGPGLVKNESCLVRFPFLFGFSFSCFPFNSIENNFFLFPRGHRLVLPIPFRQLYHSHNWFHVQVGIMTTWFRSITWYPQYFLFCLFMKNLIFIIILILFYSVRYVNVHPNVCSRLRYNISVRVPPA